MAIKEQDVVLVSKDETGNKIINMPVTRVENVEGAVKTINKVAPGADGNVNLTTVASATKATQDGSGNVITATYATKTEVTSGLAGKATTEAVNAKINITGARGLIAGYESIGNHTTITDSSPDSNETASTVTVNNGQANVCWTKIVHLTAASPSVSLGSNWKWQNGTNPELKQNGFLVLCWCNTMGLAVYNNVQ